MTSYKILFRGKELDGGMWHFGWYCRYPFGRWPLKDAIIPADDAENGYHHFVEIDGATVGRYVGMKDRNGKEIYEGDIVHCISNATEYIFIVVWDSEEFGFKATNGKTNYGSNFVYFGNCEEIEIIGNIYDNPEMIEGKESK